MGNRAGTAGANTPLLKLSDDNENRVFVLEQRAQQSEQNKQLPVEISQMLNEYLSISGSNTPTSSDRKGRKQSRRHTAVDIPKMPSIDYVYDIYYRENVQEDEFVFDKSTVGYIKIVEEDGSMIPQEDDDPDEHRLSDDEDSNEEDYYQNDYPEDEDDDRSILFGSEENEEGSDVTGANFIEEHEEHVTHDDTAVDEFDPLFNRFDTELDLLSSLNAHNYIDLDYDDENDDYENEGDGDDDMLGKMNETDDSRNGSDPIQRHRFFPTDDEDPVAIHRDEIFGKLQKMIERR